MMTEENAIQRLTNLAQEKNINWLGGTNIEAMKIVLKIANPSMEDVIDKINTISKECGFDPDKALEDYRTMERKSLAYDEIYNRVESELKILPVNDFNTNLYAKGMYDAFKIIGRYLDKVKQ